MNFKYKWLVIYLLFILEPLEIMHSWGDMKGSISGTLQNVPGDNVYPAIADYFSSVTVENILFDFKEIDSAKDWILFPLETEQSVFEFTGGIPQYSRDKDQKYLIDIYENIVTEIVLFDGYRWKIFRFPSDEHSGYEKDYVELSDKDVLYFSTTSESYMSFGWGAQGLCTINEKNELDRFFWPPLLERWQALETSDNSSPYWDSPVWDTNFFKV